MDGGIPPIHWTRNGNEIFYLGLDGNPYVVSYRMNGESFVASPPRLWSQIQVEKLAGPPVVMPDGKRLIVVRLSSEAAAVRQTHVNFLLNFSDELQRQTPAGK
jgi:hypothetical protein